MRGIECRPCLGRSFIWSPRPRRAAGAFLIDAGGRSARGVMRARCRWLTGGVGPRCRCRASTAIPDSARRLGMRCSAKQRGTLYHPRYPALIIFPQVPSVCGTPSSNRRSSGCSAVRRPLSSQPVRHASPAEVVLGIKAVEGRRPRRVMVARRANTLGSRPWSERPNSRCRFGGRRKQMKWCAAAPAINASHER